MKISSFFKDKDYYFTRFTPFIRFLSIVGILDRRGFLRELYLTYYEYNKFDDLQTGSITYLNKDAPSRYWTSRAFSLLYVYASMIKDVSDTFKPYKSWFYVYRDILQPFRGIGNVIKGIAYLSAALFVFIYEFGSKISQKMIEGNKNNVGHYLGHFFSCILDLITNLISGANYIIRGVSQIITTPLTWFLRIPLRAGFTLKYGWTTFEETQASNVENLKLLIQNHPATIITIDEAWQIDFQMHRFKEKLEKAQKRGQKIANNNLRGALMDNPNKFLIEDSQKQPNLYARSFLNCKNEWVYCKVADTEEKRAAILEKLGLFEYKNDKVTNYTDAESIQSKII